VLAPILILGVTIFDTTLVTISPLAARAAAFRHAGKTTQPTAFQSRARPPRRLLTLYLLGALGGGAAVLVVIFPREWLSSLEPWLSSSFLQASRVLSARPMNGRPAGLHRFYTTCRFECVVHRWFATLRVLVSEW